MGHARALLGLEHRRQQVEVAMLVAKKKLSVRETEALVRRLQTGPQSLKEEAVRTDPNIAKLETELAEKLGAKVRFQHASSGKGKLVISYHSLDELDGILSHIR
jgi:ParB family chromosome partitioning protein